AWIGGAAAATPLRWSRYIHRAGLAGQSVTLCTSTTAQRDDDGTRLLAELAVTPSCMDDHEPLSVQHLEHLLARQPWDTSHAASTVMSNDVSTGCVRLLGSGSSSR